MSSDAFFATERVQGLLGHPVDMAFLDGTHRFEFLLRDLIGTEAACHPRSLILLHECVPLNPRMALRQWLPGDPLETWTAPFWTGDVWKLLPILKKYRADLRLACVGLPADRPGRRVDPTSHVLTGRYYEIVDEHAATVMDEARLQSFWDELEMVDSSPKLRTRPPDRAVQPLLRPQLRHDYRRVIFASGKQPRL